MNKEKLKFHIESDDYFGTLATIIDLQLQRLKPDAEGVGIFEFLKVLEETNKVLEEKVEELKYMQENYQVVEKH